jgi:hypothetical protein
MPTESPTVHVVRGRRKRSFGIVPDIHQVLHENRFGYLISQLNEHGNRGRK